MTKPPLTSRDDVAALWRPLTDAEQTQVDTLIVKASAKLRQACPFDVDARITLFATNPTAPTALDPVVVADVVAAIVKRFLVNVNGLASFSEAAGAFSRSGTYINRYDKTGSDVRGAIQVTPSDIDQLRPSVPADVAFAFRVGIPTPAVYVPRGGRSNGQQLPAVVIPDASTSDIEHQ